MDQVLSFVIETCKGVPDLKRVYLFGSRAKGTQHLKSDYDLAFEFKSENSKSWGALTSALRENNPSLNELDLVRLDLVGPEFKSKILEEGVLLYEQS